MPTLPRGTSALLFLASFSGAACSSSSSSSSNPLCTGASHCVAISAGAAESDVTAAFAQAKDGDTIALAAGTYTFKNQLALGTANNVTIVGAGQGKTILDFHGQVQGDDALFAQSVTGLTLKDLTIEDSPGNASRFLAVTGLTIQSVEVKWNSADLKTHGAYGLYPVQSTNVLIEHCKISGASDSGIYVGQSQQIVVRDNEAFQNVAGIEIENSFFADVYGNDAHDNTGGVLVFDLPGLMQEGGHNIRIFKNTIQSNNTENFAAMGDIVSLVPGGTGFFVMANHDVEVFQNTVVGNRDSASGIISYALAQMTFTDPNYYQWPSKVYLHDNTYMMNGTMPDLVSEVGALLFTGLSAYPGGKVPDVLWDGIVDPMLASAGTNPQEICVKEPQASAVCNMHLDKLDTNNPNEGAIITCDATPFDCTLPALPAVAFPGLTPDMP